MYLKANKIANSYDCSLLLINIKEVEGTNYVVVIWPWPLKIFYEEKNSWKLNKL